MQAGRQAGRQAVAVADEKLVGRKTRGGSLNILLQVFLRPPMKGGDRASPVHACIIGIRHADTRRIGVTPPKSSL